MITEIIRDRIVKASAEISAARDRVRHVMQTIVEQDTKHPNPTSMAGVPVNPHGLSLARAVDLLDSEINGLMRELEEFRGDPEQQEAPTQLGRYK